MALRKVRLIGDDILKKHSKEVKENNEKLQELIDDMLETMYAEEGCGLAAPQVGILKRLIVVDVSEDGSHPYVVINPTISECDGVQEGSEGCLSVPGKVGIVNRPKHVKIVGKNREFQDISLEAEDFLARAFCHEVDHLDGILYVDKVEDDKLYETKDLEE